MGTALLPSGLLSMSEVLDKNLWKKVKFHPKQLAYANSKVRFNVVPAGRRSGKTMIAKRRLVKRALAYTGDAGWFIAAAPTHGQARRIYWNDLKKLTPRSMLRSDPLEGAMILPLWNGADLQVMGLDAPERGEGRPINHILLDEYGNMKPRVWTAHIRPSLTDSQGTADIIGVPEGRNHYYDLWREALANVDGEWQGHTWTTEEVICLYLGSQGGLREIEAAKRDLDPQTYEQEYRASFVNFSGRVYYQFDSAIHGSHVLPYDPNAELIFCFDFNVSPGVAAIIQEHQVDMEGKLNVGALQRTCLIGEVHIPQNSNTPAVCRKLIEQWGEHKGLISCYGDATGGAKGTAKVQGSDWDLIRAMIGGHFGQRFIMRVPSSNPYERSRVNSMNSRLRTTDGTVKMLVDPRCKNIIKDLEGVPTLEGGSGEIDKGADPRLSHISDAIGYYVHMKFGLHGTTKVTQF